MDGRLRLHLTSRGLPEIEYAYAFVGTCGYDCIVVKGDGAPDIPVVTLELELGLPLVEIPYTRLAIPSTRDDESPARGNIERTDIVCVSDKQSLSILASVPARCLSLDDGVLSTGDD